jgi:hypothetical protein
MVEASGSHTCAASGEWFGGEVSDWIGFVFEVVFSLVASEDDCENACFLGIGVWSLLAVR